MLLSSARLALRGVRTVLGRKYDLAAATSINRLLRSLGDQAQTRTITSNVHSPCPWRTLGLEQGASRGQIKRRYFELAKQTHPDTQVRCYSLCGPSDLVMHRRIWVWIEP